MTTLDINQRFNENAIKFRQISYVKGDFPKWIEKLASADGLCCK